MSAFVDIHQMHAWFLRKPKESISSPVTRVTGFVSHCVRAGDCTLVLCKDMGTGSPFPSADSTMVPFVFCISAV